MDSVRIPQDDIQKQEIDLNKKWLLEMYVQLHHL